MGNYWNSRIKIKKRSLKSPSGYLSEKRKRSLKGRKKRQISSLNEVVRLLRKQEKSESRRNLIKKLDKLVSDYVKRKAEGKCQRCGQVRKNAGVSHYFGRKHIGTRWCLENLDWACWGCHLYHMEKEKNPGGWYYNYMIKKLGEKKFKTLEIMAYSITKFSRQDIQFLINFYENKTRFFSVQI